MAPISSTAVSIVRSRHHVAAVAMMCLLLAAGVCAAIRRLCKSHRTRGQQGESEAARQIEPGPVGGYVPACR